MKDFTLSNIDTSFSYYNRFAALYDDLSFTNEISVRTENPDILSVLQRNNSYVMNELLSRPDLPAMTVFMNSERLEAGSARDCARGICGCREAEKFQRRAVLSRGKHSVAHCVFHAPQNYTLLMPFV